jgi:hypothetical protein
VRRTVPGPVKGGVSHHRPASGRSAWVEGEARNYTFGFERVEGASRLRPKRGGRPAEGDRAGTDN